MNIKPMVILWIKFRKICEIKPEYFSFTVKLGCNELGYNELSVITNEYFGPKLSFTKQINPVITNPGYNEQIWPVPSCLL